MDIKSREDIERLIFAFYDKLLQVEDIKPVFDGINFQSHVPHIVSFWSFVLLDEAGYKTNVFDKHINLPIKLYMFDVWLEVFTETVDNLFKGEKAEMAKQRAATLAYTFKSKWETIKKEA
ncbi:MAG: group III truncated hemoglobin [Bacteroidota bacterium]|nr:group III truncated hemoglobin [Bacteroidota bacterium]